MTTITLNDIAYRVAKYGRITRDEPRHEELDAIAAQIRELVAREPKPEQAVCATCKGWGEVGGLLPGDGRYQNDPCPDCTKTEQAAGDGVLSGKYGNVLRPFIALMERELHANAGKGDRPGWLAMDRKTALLEIFYHLAKLQKAAKDDDQDGIREYGADVANMSMMLVDVCGALPVGQELVHV